MNYYQSSEFPGFLEASETVMANASGLHPQERMMLYSILIHI